MAPSISSMPRCWRCGMFIHRPARYVANEPPTTMPPLPMYFPGLNSLSAVLLPRRRRLIEPSSGCTANASAVPPASQYTLLRRGICLTSSTRLCPRADTNPRVGFTPASPTAQLLQPNAGGLTMGVIVLNVTDVAAHKKFWVDEFDAKILKVGQLEGATIPGFVILFRPQAPTGPHEGTTINHMGLKLK